MADREVGGHEPEKGLNEHKALMKGEVMSTFFYLWIREVRIYPLGPVGHHSIKAASSLIISVL
jgi:hypothetical protein